VTEPVVGHVARNFLAPTETFVWNQVRTLERYRPVAFCRRRTDSFDYPFEVVSARDVLPPALRVADDLAYAARWLVPPAAAALARAALERSVALLHFHYLVDARFFLGMKRRLDVPSVVSGYGYDVSHFPRSFRGLGARYLAPLFEEIDCFLAMSDDMAADMVALGCPREKVVVHYYGTDTDRFDNPHRRYEDKDVVDVLMCGTLEPKKAQDRVLLALRRWEATAGRDAPGFRVTFVGDGPLRGELERITRELGWDQRVTFLGHVPHEDPSLEEAYARADVFALPSVTIAGDKEGIPGTIVEAMASGLPVVSTYHAGIPAVVENGRSGLLVDEEDLDGLGNALGRLIADTSLREALGTRARADAAARLRLQGRTPQLESIYDSLLARRRSGRSARR
jgi:colanic acid/amylovoran biosynthesis glycosyltransferase